MTPKAAKKADGGYGTEVGNKINPSVFPEVDASMQVVLDDEEMTPKAADRPMLEDGECSSDIEMPTYKQGRAYAIRDFPENCGPNAPMANVRGTGAEVENKITPSVPEVDASVLQVVQDDGELESMNDELLGSDEKNSTVNDGCQKHLSLVAQSQEVDESLPPLGASCSVDGGARNKVRELLRSFQAIIRKLAKEGETDPKKRQGQGRIDLRALDIFKAKGEYSTSEKSILGQVPGVEVGDEFHFRVELMIMKLHRLPQGGIDYIEKDEMKLATSIVESGVYDDNQVDNSDVWVYTGQGGKDGQQDQKLEKGNLALKNSIQEKNVVRVIRGVNETIHSSTSGGKPQILRTYTYYGLYTVERSWEKIGRHGKNEFKFELKRVPGQPAIAWKEVQKSKNFRTREGPCVDDISEGKEKFPVHAINTIDGNKPPPFTYVTCMIYPVWCNPLPPQGCDCIKGCSDSEPCSCIVKNGGEIPYNLDGAIVEIKPLVYECGPSCKCSPCCTNRVSQLGIKIQLEIFKTKRRGWGVRSLCSIPSGTFICEYTGKLLDDKEAEKRAGNDEYLFDIGGKCTDHSLSVVAEVGFTIDAARYGNVGRFINHSCSPNLYAQNVLYDHDDARMPHIMLFAAENIPPLKELNYDYNYAVGQVSDKDGNVKSKPCYCGSADCTGFMY